MTWHSLHLHIPRMPIHPKLTSLWLCFHFVQCLAQMRQYQRSPERPACQNIIHWRRKVSPSDPSHVLLFRRACETQQLVYGIPRIILSSSHYCLCTPHVLLPTLPEIPRRTRSPRLSASPKAWLRSVILRFRFNFIHSCRRGRSQDWHILRLGSAYQLNHQ